ncbi:MAG: hypothetical protein K2K75_00715 [Muribaculaceae bacterium]|nr:hypothetical protein [Muribaculaceae bacterium]
MLRVFPFILSLLFTIGCKQQSSQPPSEPSHTETNSVYYWKTVLNLDSTNVNFLRDNNIGRIYMRMFDVVEDKYAILPKVATIPNATIRINADNLIMLRDNLADIEVVPVVYITLEALRRMKGNEGVLANNIATRVRNMVQYNELPNVSEIQLDCDWTQSTEESYFRLCDSVKGYLGKLDLQWDLSSTIRLHQLSKKVPPVDRGVLMVYNTGSFNNPDTKNSIIDPADVEPYLKHLGNYPLHLDVAYPTYSWQLLFHKRGFKGMLSNVDVNDTTKFLRKEKTQYIAKRDIPHNKIIIREGDIIRNESSQYQDIIKVKGQIDSRLSSKKHSNIIYHLDSANLSKYNSNEIQNILSIAD